MSPQPNDTKTHVGEVDSKNQVGEAVPDDGVTNAQEPLIEWLNRVVGVVSPNEGTNVASELAASGFGELVDSVCGEQGAKRIDFAGERHGLLGKVNRTLHWANEDKYMRRYEAELLAGNCVVLAYADDDEKIGRAHRIIQGHGGRYINHFGSMVITELEK